MKLLIFISIWVALLCGCSKPTEAQLLKGKSEIVNVIAVLEKAQSQGRPLPATQADLELYYKSVNGVPYPEGVNYALFQGRDYKLYCYVSGRTSLWYLSFDDGAQGKGWWLDDESGTGPKKL